MCREHHIIYKRLFCNIKKVRRLTLSFGRLIKLLYFYSDGGNVIAEYDGNNNLTRKYIHGARIDELVCMIDVADNNAAYYYHYDGSGSVVALSNSYGNSCQSYEYSAYGQVAASNLEFTANPYMYTGRRFDYETGLYYYRARYYNPYTGRFLQTDPIGYDDGMNLYRYTMNNPLNLTDPSGCSHNWGPHGPTCKQQCSAVHSGMVDPCGCDLKCYKKSSAAVAMCKLAADVGVKDCFKRCLEDKDDDLYDPKPAQIFEKGRDATYKGCEAGNISDKVLTVLGILMGFTSLLGSVLRMWKYTLCKKLAGINYCYKSLILPVKISRFGHYIRMVKGDGKIKYPLKL